MLLRIREQVCDYQLPESPHLTCARISGCAAASKVSIKQQAKLLTIAGFSGSALGLLLQMIRCCINALYAYLRVHFSVYLAFNFLALIPLKYVRIFCVVLK